MEIIDAPNIHPPRTDLFLAGGISNCPDWQEEVIALLDGVPGIGLNPRRRGEFTESIANEQIEWEFRALRTADTVLFWFPKETLCPITLFELGVFTCRKDTRLVVGTHPDYARRFDVIKQLELARPEVAVVDSIADLVAGYKRSLQAAHGLLPAEPSGAKIADVDYRRVEGIVKDELQSIINVGTVADLRGVIKENYKDVDASLVSHVIADLADREFIIAANGRVVSRRTASSE